MIGEYNLLIGIYICIAMIMIYTLKKRDILFSIVLLYLILYSVFTMIGYVNYPYKLYIVSRGQYYGTELFPSFFTYILVFIILTYVFHLFFRYIKPSSRPHLREVQIPGGKSLFRWIMALQLAYLYFMLLTNYSRASYWNQSILKSNKLWLFLFTFSGIDTILILNILLKHRINKQKIPIIDSVMCVLFAMLIILTSMVFGQRIELFMTITSVSVIALKTTSGRELNLKTKRTLRRLLLVLIVILPLFQYIRSYRGLNIMEYDVSLEDTLTGFFKSLTNIEDLVFQDWLNPALSLATCLNYRIIEPMTVIRANLSGLVPSWLISRTSITTVVYDYFDPGTSVGYGFYFATEGYMLAGEIGCVISAFAISLYYKLYDSFLYVDDDREYNTFISSVLAFYIISFVRAYSLFFIKGLLYYVFPAIFLYALYTGKAPTRMKV